MNHLTSDQDNNQPVKHNPDEIVTSWRDLDTSTPEGLRALNVVIARRLGWRFEHVLSINAQHWFIVSNPENEIAAVTCGHGWWPIVAHDTLPQYTTDANAALTLLDNTRPRWSIDVDYSAPARKRYSVSTFYGKWLNGQAETLELAICKAWLAYMDSNEPTPAPKEAWDELQTHEDKLRAAMRVNAQAAAAGGKREAGE